MLSKKKPISLKRCGIEKEALRVDSDGHLILTPHPTSLGHKLTHPLITTDFAEMQLEWTTPTFSSHTKLCNYLKNLLAYTQKKLPKESFWPFSMPPKLPEVEGDWIAHYGNSTTGKKKETYRRGLKEKYGQRMQLISGFHYNISLDFKTKDHKAISTNYLHIVRNFIRHHWILHFLFGASPTCDSTFGPLPKLPFATSIRNSRYGYLSKEQNKSPFTFNSVKEFVTQMDEAIESNRLQIENELYSPIRPKCLPHTEAMQYEAIEKRGIEYLEIRALDLDPFSPLGISREAMDFVYLFLVYCYCIPSPPLSANEHIKVSAFAEEIALSGRDPKHQLFAKAMLILDDMEKLSDVHGKKKIIKWAKKVFRNKAESFSTKIANKPFMDLGIQLCRKHSSELKKVKISEQVIERCDCFARCSLEQEKILSQAEEMENSTRLMIEEAIRRHIHVEILDHHANVLRLARGKTERIVVQATKTSKDNYLSATLMENKKVTKQLLEEWGLPVPKGKQYTSIETALAAPPPTTDCVIKPNSTNYGIGIAFVSKGDLKGLRSGILQAFGHDQTILIEDWIHGSEYRFLVIDGKVSGVVLRDPASVTGDGCATVAQLIHKKFPHIPLTQEEQNFIEQKGYLLNGTPKKGEKIYIRPNSNVSTGGESIDWTEKVDPRYNVIAVKAAECLDACFCGVDMIITDPTQKPTKTNHGIIELNFNPALYIHQEPTRGRPRNVAGAVLDALDLPFIPITEIDCC